MLPRPLHRWKSFWLGLFMIALLGRLWVRSVYCMDGWLALYRSYDLEVEQAHGALGIDLAYRPATGPGLTHFQRKVYGPQKIEPGPWFATPYAWRSRTAGIPGWSMYYSHPYWHLMLFFTIPWAGLLAWRWWKGKHAAILLPADDPG